VPSDYAILKIHTKPKTGGDTLWSSAYEAYDRLTPTFRGFLETLTATHQGTQFLEVSKRLGFPIAKNRGAPENNSPEGDDLTAIHPVIRTNPVTGWKGLFVNRAYPPSFSWC
jgi:alpha-ketoglutarate-dependent taurine dioxygenase